MQPLNVASNRVRKLKTHDHVVYNIKVKKWSNFQIDFYQGIQVHNK